MEITLFDAIMMLFEDGYFHLMGIHPSSAVHVGFDGRSLRQKNHRFDRFIPVAPVGWDDDSNWHSSRRREVMSLRFLQL